MDLNYYQEQSRETAIYHGQGSFVGAVYNSLKLAGEAGEIADKVGKLFGKGAVPTNEQILDFRAEAGDVLWHLTNLCTDLGIDMNDVAKVNLAKLRSRQERGVIDGHGDNR